MKRIGTIKYDKSTGEMTFERFDSDRIPTVIELIDELVQAAETCGYFHGSRIPIGDSAAYLHETRMKLLERLNLEEGA